MSWKARLSRNMQELRVLFCPNSKASLPTRFYFEKNFNEIVQLNPGFAFAIRESEDTEPTLYAQYGTRNESYHIDIVTEGGWEEKRNLTGLTETEIEAKLKEICEIGGHITSPPTLSSINDIIKAEDRRKSKGFFPTPY